MTQEDIEHVTGEGYLSVCCIGLVVSMSIWLSTCSVGLLYGLVVSMSMWLSIDFGWSIRTDRCNIGHLHGKYRFKFHYKIGIVDGGLPSCSVIAGSINWTGSGGESNDENMVIFTNNQELCDAYQQEYDRLWSLIGTTRDCVSYQPEHPVSKPDPVVCTCTTGCP